MPYISAGFFTRYFVSDVLFIRVFQHYSLRLPITMFPSSWRQVVDWKGGVHINPRHQENRPTLLPTIEEHFKVSLV